MLLVQSTYPIGCTSNQETINKEENILLKNNDTWINIMLKLGHMPSLAVGIIHQNGTFKNLMYGEHTRGTNLKPSKYTIYYGGSISKTITATALLQLFEQGLFDLDEDINNYLSFSIRNPMHPETPITFKMLLTHTSSLSNIQWKLFLYFSLLNYPHTMFEDYLTPGNPIYDKNNWNSYKPGEGIYYSSVGYELIGLLIESISGMPFETYCRHHIFLPLKMYNTSFTLNHLLDSEFASFYAYGFGMYVPIPLYENHNAAAGGIFTTVEDLSHFLFIHMNNGTYTNTQILKNNTIEMMHSPQFPNLPILDPYDDGRTYGLGWIIWPENATNVAGGFQGHFGNVPGGISSITMTNKTGVILLSNQWLLYYPLQLKIMSLFRQIFHGI